MELVLRDDLTPESITKFFIEDPKLCIRALADNDLSVLYYEKAFPLSPSSIHVGVYDMDDSWDDIGELVAVIKMEKFTELSLCVHPYIASQYHGAGITGEVVSKLREYILKELPNYTKVVTTVPSSCEAVIKSVTKMGMQLEATLKDMFTWRQKVVDLLIYSINLNKEEQ